MNTTIRPPEPCNIEKVIFTAISEEITRAEVWAAQGCYDHTWETWIAKNAYNDLIKLGWTAET